MALSAAASADDSPWRANSGEGRYSNTAQQHSSATKHSNTAPLGFNRATTGNVDVGVYHETYRVRPGDYENVFVNMPPTLMSEVAPVEQAGGKLASARGRIDAVK